MSKNEIKVTISANNQPFLKAIAGCIDQINRLEKSARNSNKKMSAASTNKIQTGKLDTNSSEFVGHLDEINKKIVKLGGSFNSISAGKLIEDIRSVNAELVKAAKSADKLITNVNGSKRTKTSVNNESGNNTPRLGGLDRTLSSARKLQTVLTSINAELNTVQKNVKNINTHPLSVTGLNAAVASAKSLIASLNSINAQLATAGAAAAKASDSSSASGKSAQSQSGLLENLSQITIIGAGAIGALNEIKTLAETVFGTGFRYNKQMETSKLGIAGILMSMTTLNGSQLKLNEALQVSDGLLKKIQKSAATVGLPANEMMSAFQSVIGPGLEAKMTLEELVEYVPTATKAVKTMLGSMADESQVTQELRAMISGDISMDAQVSKAIGITKAGVDKAKENAGGLFQYLMDKMAGFKAIAVEWPKTMTGALEKFKTMYEQASGNAFEKIFTNSKNELNELTQTLFKVDEKTKEINFNPELLTVLRELVDNTILLAEKIMFAGNTVIPYLGSPLQIVGNLLKYLIENIYGVTTAITTWMVIQRVTPLYRAFAEQVAAAKTEFLKTKTAATAATTAVTTGATKATIAIGRMEAALITLKTAIRGLASATLWGAIAAAAGMAVEKVMEYIENIDKKKKEKENVGKDDNSFGWLSKSQEGDYDTVSTGENDPYGGISYGSWQFSSKQGTADRFVEWLGKNGWDAYKLLSRAEPGTEAFESLWHQSAKHFGQSFENAQRAFMKETYYDPSNENLKEKYGFDAGARSGAMREVVTSTAVQHGNTGMLDVMELASQIAGVANISYLTDEQLIPYIYEARAQKFPQDRDRYNAEKQLALNNLAQYPQNIPLGKINTDDLRVKEQEANDEEIKKSQKALQLATEKMVSNAELEKTVIEKNLERLEYEKENLGIIEYANQKVALQQQQLQIDADVAQGKKDLIENALYKEPDDKTMALTKAENEITMAARKLSDFAETVDDAGRIVGIFSKGVTSSQEGTTWKRSVADNPNIEDLDEKAKQAISQLADYFFKLTGKQMVVSSGKRSGVNGGGHTTGMKFDVVDDLDSLLLEDNVNGTRDKLLAYAQKLGITRPDNKSDEYKYPSEKSTNGHLDFDATNFYMGMESTAKEKIGNAHSKIGKEIYDGIMKLYQDADDIISQLNEIRGDSAKGQKEAINAKHIELIKAFETAGLTEYADKVRELRSIEFTRIDFSKTKQDLENASFDLNEFQTSLVKSVSDSSVSAGALMQAYIERYHEQTDKYRKELQTQLRDAIKGADIDTANKIKTALKALDETLQTGLSNIISAYNQELQMQLAEIDANKDMTSMQRQDAIDSAKRQQYAREADEARKDAEYLRSNNGKTSDIYDLERSAAIKEKLAEIPSLLDDIHRASTQAFEDGLLDFLTRGILECESLGDALKELAITVLQSIQKVTAEELTKNIMIDLGLGVKNDKEGDGKSENALGGAALIGQFGGITAQTSAFLTTYDSLMGQFAIKTQQGYQNILQTMSFAMNSVPSFGFPTAGGGDGDSGGFDMSFGYDPNDLDWWKKIPGLAEGGSIDSGLISGPGTGTSDSILTYASNIGKFISLSNGEYVIRSQAVQKWGTNFLDRLNSGMDFAPPQAFVDVRDKYAGGGILSGMSPSTGRDGAYGLSAEVANSFNPTVEVINNVNKGELGNFIDSRVNIGYDRNMREKAKLLSMLIGKFQK